MSSMSFEEMQTVLQGILLSQQQLQSSQQQLQLSQQQFQLDQQQLQLSQQEFQSELTEIKAVADRAIQIAESNGRAIQSMLDQAATDRLEEKERAQRHEEEMRELRATNRGLVNLTVLIDEDRPTILRLLNSNNNKLDLLLDRLPPQQQ
jgi:hypothetical protein